MGKEKAIDQLSQDDKNWLDKRLMDKGFCGYEEIAALLAERGYSVSKSSIHRYGQKLERKLAAVQASTQAALLIADAAPDDADARSQAVLSLVQTQLFNALVAMQEVDDADIDPEKRLQLLSKIGVGISMIAKASMEGKKWQVEVRDKATAAAQKVESLAKQGGLNDATVQEIRRAILGIAD